MNFRSWVIMGVALWGGCAATAQSNVSEDTRDAKRRIDHEKQEAQPKAGRNSPSVPAKPVAAAAKGRVTVYTDHPCHLEINGQRISIAVGSTVLMVAPGQHAVTCVSTEHADVRYHGTHLVRVGENSQLSIALAQEVENRVAHLQAQRLAAQPMHRVSNPAVMVASANIDAHLITPGDGTIIDTKTHLQWMQNDSGPIPSWSAATAECARLGSTWRLPALSELKTLIDPTQTTYCGGTSCRTSGQFHLNGPLLWSNRSDSSHTALALDLTSSTALSQDVQRGDLRALCVRWQP